MDAMIIQDTAWSDYVTNLKKKCRDKKTPISATFELTARCNFNCRMCYVHLTEDEIRKIGKEYAAGEWIDLGRQLFDAGTLFLLLTGGEVFLRPDFRQIYETFSEMGFVISINSNGYLIDDETVCWLKERPPMRLQITLYGACNETYEKITGVPHAYDRVIHNIEQLIRARIPLTLAFTEIKDNADEMCIIKDYAEANGLQFIHNSNIYKPVRGAHSDAEHSRLSFDPLKMDKGKIIKVESLYPVGDGAFDKCGSNNCGAWFTWNGKMSICAFIAEPCSNPMENGFSEAWNELQNTLSLVKKPEACVGCRYGGFCSACPGAFASETGFLDKTCETICNKAKELYDLLSSAYDKQ